MPEAEVAADRRMEREREREKWMCRIIRKEDPLCHHVETVDQRSESFGHLTLLG